MLAGKGGLPHSRQSAKPFLQPSELGLPQPLTRRPVCPPPPGSGGRGTLVGEREVGRVPGPTRGHNLWFSLYIRTLWAVHCSVQCLKRGEGSCHSPPPGCGQGCLGKEYSCWSKPPEAIILPRRQNILEEVKAFLWSS
jgi:hypothetical protein